MMECWIEVTGEVTFLYIPLEMLAYPGFKGLKRSHLSGFTVAFDYDIYL